MPSERQGPPWRPFFFFAGTEGGGAPPGSATDLTVFFFLLLITLPFANVKMKTYTEEIDRKAAVGSLRRRRGMGTCVLAHVLETRAPVYGCVHMLIVCVIV